MSRKQPISRRASVSDPCPVCNSGTKGCSVTADDLHLCRGEPIERERWVDVLKGAADPAGFHHYRRADESRRRNDPKAVFNPPPPPSKWQEKAERYAKALDTDKRAALADALALPPLAIDAIALVGWKADESAFIFPEWNGSNSISGLLRRMADGSKKAMNGSTRGLCIPKVVADRREPGDVLFIVEGPSDVLAMTTAGLDCVGRPSYSGGAAFLAELLRHKKYDRIVVVGENDKKPDGLYPGRKGAERVAKVLAAELKRSISLAMPPATAKDVRAWLTSAERGKALWPERGSELSKVLLTNAERIDPPAPSASEKSAQGDPVRFVPDVTVMSEVKLREVKWHWPGRIPAGMVTIVFGPPGVSKSIITCFIAAATTKGLLWPDGGIAPQGSVVFLACKDDPETTIGTRLKAAGADLNKITMINGKEPDGESGGKGFVLAVSLQDLDLIEQVLPPDCKVLIIDPAGSHMGPGVDNHRDNEVRDVLMPLALLARKRGIAVILVCHSNKTMSNQLAMDAIIGSRGFSGVVRSVLACMSDPDAADYPKRKLLLHAKCNVAPLANGLGYTLDNATDVIGNPPRIVWDEEPLCGVVADDYMGRVRLHGAAAANRRGGPRRHGPRRSAYWSECWPKGRWSSR